MATAIEATTDPVQVQAKYPSLQHLLAWISEREAIRKNREAGRREPLTDDPILNEYSFCNVRRENDRVTCWIRENWREPHRDDPDLWFAMAVARLVNWPDSLAEIGYPVPWSRELFVSVMSRPEKVWGGAYVIPAGAKGVAKHEHVANIIDGLWKAREGLRPKAGTTLQLWQTALEQQDGLGSFLAAQIVADMKYVEPLRSAPDWMTFAASGPGSRRGLNRILGRPVDARWIEEEWRSEFHQLRAVVTPELERLAIADLHAQDFQNCLCEADKYIRALLGDGKPKRRRRGFVTRDEGKLKPRPAPQAENDSPSAAKGQEAGSVRAKIDASASTPAGMSHNPFADLNAMRLSQDFAANTHVKKLLVTVPIRRPSTQDFFRVHPDPAYQMPAAAIIELRDEREVYFVPPAMVPEVAGEFRAVSIVTVINRQGVLSLWALKLPSPDGRREDWSFSALKAAEMAKTRWVRLRANMNLGAYEIFEAQDTMPEPEWPDIPFAEILHTAFRDRLIDNVDHPVLKRLRGAS